MSQELLTRAIWWLSQGVELVPLRSQTKAVIKGYGTHSKHITTERDARFWFGKLGVNLGLVCGGLIGLVCADFDDAQAYEEWHTGAGKNVTTLTERTARGYHAYFKCPGLPSAATHKVELKSHGIVMASPSVHPSGMRYEVVTRPPIATLAVEQAYTLFPFVSAVIERQSAEWTPRSRQDATSTGDLVSRIKAARQVSDEAAELTELKGQGDRLFGRCPFHEDTNPSFWVDDRAGLWGCYSPTCPTNAGGQKAHDVINLRAFAENISLKDAIKQLADELLPLSR
jgi:hypothetical protein